MTTPRALFVNGTVGSGKTTTIEHIGDLLREADVPHALLDLDWLRNAWPAPVGDTFRTGLELANLASVAANATAAGYPWLVLAGVVEDPAMLPRYEEAVGGPVTVVRLHVDLEWVRSRLERRHLDDPAGRSWHVRRAGELQAILEASRSREQVVRVVAGETPRQVAVRVLQAAGWMQS